MAKKIHGLNYSRYLEMRIDIIAADRELARRVHTTWIDHVERSAQRPSDHAALVVDFDLAKGPDNVRLSV